MAVQVQVKGPKNGVDFTLLGHDARIERVQLEKEVVVITDVNNTTLYMVPLKNVRLIHPLRNLQEEIPRSFGADSSLKVHIIGDSEGDFEQTCNLIDYTKRYDTLMAELKNVTLRENEEPIVDLLIALPYENIRYIDFNHYVGTNDSPKGTTDGKPKAKPRGDRKKVNTKPTAGAGQGNKPKPKPKVSGRPNIKTKARK